MGGGALGGGGGRQNPTKMIASLTSVIKLVKYFGIVGGIKGGGALRGGEALKSYKIIIAHVPSLR